MKIINYKIFASFFLVFVLIVYVVLSNIKFDKDSVYTLVFVTKREVAGQGGSCFIDVFYNGKTYKTELNSIFCQESTYYFAKVLPYRPQSAELIQMAVPDCILKRPVPNEGWKEIPKCP